MGNWECYRCSYVTEAENPPEECPNCHYSTTFWIGHVENKPATVKDFVKGEMLTIDVNKSAWEAATLMRENDTGSVIITINGIAKGIVTERDILNKIAAEDLPASKVLLKKIMSSPIISTTSDTLVTQALAIMAKHHIRRLLVTENGGPIGMVSQRALVGGSFRPARHESAFEDKDRA